LRNLPMLSPELPNAPEAHAGSAFGRGSGVRSASNVRGTGERMKMNHPMESEMVTIEEVVDNSKVWRSKWESNGDARFQTLNARGVEFIAKPGKIQDLRNCIRDRVLEHLKLATGFSSAIVLTSHKEQRLVLVLTFWTTETQARNNCWEHAPAVRQAVQPLIDVCSRVQTYEVAVPKLSAAEMRESGPRAC
jgi:hypothetical protein